MSMGKTTYCRTLKNKSIAGLYCHTVHTVTRQIKNPVIPSGGLPTNLAKGASR